MKKFKIFTLGCKVNQYDSDSLKRKLEANGFLCCEDEKDADFFIVNTCAVTKNAIRKSRRTFEGLKKKNKDAFFVLMGCWVQAYKKEALKLKADIVWGTGNLNALLKSIVDRFLEEDKKEILSDKSKELSLLKKPQLGEKSRYFLKIQDGCEQFCSYCIIPYTRGKLRSRRVDEILEEVRFVVKNGFGEIVLCGIHLGLYGKEENSSAGVKNLHNLLQEIIKIEGLGRLRLSSIEVNDVSDELIDLITSTDKICNHLHISLQSGSDKVLKAMNRPYKTSDFQRVVNLLREKDPFFSITTDIIIGFPGETENDFEDTFKFAKEMNFSKIHIFPFSAHEKTKAFYLNDRISKFVIKERVSKMRLLEEAMRKAYIERFKGMTQNCLLEYYDKKSGVCKLKSEYYFDVFCMKRDFSESVQKILEVSSLVATFIK